MRQVQVTPRADWPEKCVEDGFTFYDDEAGKGRTYWNEDVALEFPMAEIDMLEEVTAELYSRCLDAIDYVIRNDRLAEFGIPEAYHSAIKASWYAEDPEVYGRFDFAYDGIGPVKMLEFNADTPTTLLESAVIQWRWMREVMGPGADQFNSIHEKLVERWKHLREEQWHLPEGATLHVACLERDGDGNYVTEDMENAAYMAETAQAAGFKPKLVYMEDIGWDVEQERFVDGDGEPIEQVFKLYPWEWMAQEAFGDKVLESIGKTRWVEPLWKMLWSNKQLLVVLHELFPNHPNILPAYNTPEQFRRRGQGYVQKPILGREGANVTIYGTDGKPIETLEGEYDTRMSVYQQRVRLGNIGLHCAIGSWVVGGEPAGISIRGTESLITNNHAEFIPHYIPESEVDN